MSEVPDAFDAWIAAEERIMSEVPDQTRDRWAGLREKAARVTRDWNLPPLDASEVLALLDERDQAIALLRALITETIDVPILMQPDEYGEQSRRNIDAARSFLALSDEENP